VYLRGLLPTSDRRSGLNATEVISYQYLGMTKIAGALNMLPKTMLRQNITNPSTNEVIKQIVATDFRAGNISPAKDNLGFIKICQDALQ
jgi:hypothetical protein